MNVGVLQRSEHFLNLPYTWGVRFSETNHGWGFFWLFLRDMQTDHVQLSKKTRRKMCTKKCSRLLIEEIRHQFLGSSSHYLKGL